MVRDVAHALAPGAVVVIAAGAATVLPAVAEPVDAFLASGYAVVFGMAAILALAFGRSRPLLAILALAAAASVHARGVSDDTATAVAGWVVLLLPLDLAAAAVLPNRPVVSAAGVRRVAAVAAQAAFVALARAAYADAILELPRRAPFAALAPALLAVPQLAQLAFAVAAATACVAVLVRRDAVTGALAWTVPLAFLALSSAGREHALTLLTAAALAVAAAVVQAAARAATRDHLTGLPGRQAFNEALAAAGGRFALAVADIDHFKRVNDTYGHPVGDQVLRMVAARLADLPGRATAYRFGGEEFTVLLPGSSTEEAAAALDELRRAIAATPFFLRGPDRPKEKPERPSKSSGSRPQIRVTVSIGVAARDAAGATPADVLAAADAALYRAKKAGRNRVERG